MKSSYTSLTFTQIFPSDIKNKIAILTLVYQTPNGVFLADILENVGLSRKTIYKYLKEINILSSECFNEDIIVLSNSKKYFFTKNKVDFFTLRSLLIEESHIPSLISSFLKSPSISIPLFCSENFITEAGLKIQLRLYNRFLRPFGISLKTKKDRLYIKGEEIKIRYLIATFLWRTYRGTKWPFTSLSREKLKKVTESIHSGVLNIDSPSIAKAEVFLYLLATNILRAKTKSLIETKTLPSYFHCLGTSTFTKFKENLSQNYPIPDDEIEYNILLVYLFPEFFLFNNSTSKILEILCENQSETYWSIMHFVNFAKERHKNWNPNSYSGHLFLSTVISARIFIDIFKDLYFNIYDLRLVYHAQNEFPSLLPSLENVIREENKKMPETILKALVFRYAQAYITTFPPQDFEPRIFIQIITDMPIYIEILLVNRIKSLLSEQFNFKISTSLKTETPDLVIATGIVDDIFNDCKTIYVYPHLSLTDTQNVLNSCKEILKEKYHHKT